ncbi:MAG: sulfite exporter TauE/SafE family protein [Xanthobacteraceae bacterium]|nr:sulfite exporter TauE/SafE family protein [Xanthobacteraceae bacterium]
MWNDPAILGLAIFGLLIAGVIKGATGLGYTSCALPFLAAAIGLKEAISLVLLPAIASNLLVVFFTPHRKEILFRFAPMYAATIPGILIGVYLLVWVDQRISTALLGVLIVAYSVLSIRSPSLSIPASLERPLQVPVGLLNGFFTGLTGSQVLPLVPYILALPLDPHRTTQAVNLTITIASLFMMIALQQSGVASADSLIASIAAIVPALLGIYLGTLCRSLIPAQHYRLYVQITLGLLGVGLIARQFF